MCPLQWKCGLLWVYSHHYCYVVKFKRPEAVNNILRIKGQKGSAKSLSQDQTPGTVIYKKEPEFTDEVCFSFQILKSHLSLHSPPPKTKDLL